MSLIPDTNNLLDGTAKFGRTRYRAELTIHTHEIYMEKEVWARTPKGAAEQLSREIDTIILVLRRMFPGREVLRKEDLVVTIRKDT